jgi:hypothetical protein
LEATRPQREAEEERIKNIKEWKESKEAIVSIYKKPKKILGKDRKKVERLLEVQFPVTERGGESKDKAVTQISRLKFIPKQVRPLTQAEQRERRKVGQSNQGIKMHISEYYQGLIYKSSGKSEVVDRLNHVWVRNCFEERFVNLVQEIGLDETRRNIDLEKRKWVNVPIGESSSRDLDPSLELNIPVHYQQGDCKTCLFRLLASALHYLGQKHTGSVLASIAKKNENLGGDKQLQEIIRAMKKHETVYKKMDYWRKEKVLVQKDFLGNPCSYPKLLVLRGHDGGTQHAVAVVGTVIFDSNRKNGMRLCKETLDWCCNCFGGFDRVQTAIQFRT